VCEPLAKYLQAHGLKMPFGAGYRVPSGAWATQIQVILAHLVAQADGSLRPWRAASDLRQ